MKYLVKKLFLFVFCMTASILSANTLDIVWEQEFGDKNNLSYVAHESIYTDNVLKTIGYAFESQTQTAGQFWSWQIDDAGEILSQNSFHTLSKENPSAIGFGSWRTKGMIVRQNSLYFAGTFGTGQSTFAHYKTDNQTFNYNLIQPNPHKTSEDLEKGYKETILRIIHSDGSFVLMGSDTDSNGIAKQVDSSGTLVWQNVYEKGTISFIVDGLVLENNLILLECYTEADPVKKPYEGYHCRLLKCDLDGKILSEKSFVGGSAFPNKHPELHKIDSRSFLVGYDRNFLPNQIEYSVAAYDNTLKLLWEKAVSGKNEQGRIPIYTHILPVSVDGFIAAYTEMGSDGIMSIQVQRYNVEEDCSDSLLLTNYVAIDGFQLVGSNDKVFITALTVPDENYRTRVKIAAVSIR
ncbi:MAG: hypothetical protein J7K65_08370 [Planctomycetes bacterium]|nr:hypothetical protein [Planctomycetota bacterium]